MDAMVLELSALLPNPAIAPTDEKQEQVAELLWRVEQYQSDSV
jgi:hypothetical protein